MFGRRGDSLDSFAEIGRSTSRLTTGSKYIAFKLFHNLLISFFAFQPEAAQQVGQQVVDHQVEMVVDQLLEQIVICPLKVSKDTQKGSLSLDYDSLQLPVV